MSKRPLEDLDASTHPSKRFRIDIVPEVGLDSLPEDVLVHGILTAQGLEAALTRLLLALTSRFFWQFYLKYYHSELSKVRGRSFLDSCIRYGTVSTVDFALSLGRRFHANTSLDASIESGNLLLFQKVLSGISPVQRHGSPLVTCARVGNLEMAKYIKDVSGWPCNLFDDNILIRAPDGGNLEFLEWAYQSGFAFSHDASREALRVAGYHGRMDFLRLIYFEAHYFDIPDMVFSAAAENGKIDFLKELHRTQRRLPFLVAHSAATYGKLDVLAYYFSVVDPHSLLNHGETARLYLAAARFGRVEVLEMFWSNAGLIPPEPSTVVTAAIRNSEKKVFKWLMDHNFSMNSECFKLAVQSGQDWKEEALRLLELGCPFGYGGIGACATHYDDDFTLAKHLLKVIRTDPSAGGFCGDYYLEAGLDWDAWEWGQLNGIPLPILGIDAITKKISTLDPYQFETMSQLLLTFKWTSREDERYVKAIVDRHRMFVRWEQQSRIPIEPFAMR